MRYLLDANAVIALLNDTTSPIARRIRRYAPRDIGVSAVVIHELYYGGFKSQRVEKNLARVDALQFLVLEFDQEDARQAGQIRAHLASKGTPTGPYDLLIAGQAKARKLTLITHNTTEFARVPGLKVEDWKVASPPAAPSRQKSPTKPRSRPLS
jgi:tRNA(fMet)-specific endonuclease VapC